MDAASNSQSHDHNRGSSNVASRCSGQPLSPTPAEKEELVAHEHGLLHDGVSNKTFRSVLDRPGPRFIFFLALLCAPVLLCVGGCQKLCSPALPTHEISKKIYGCAQSRRARGSTIGRPLLEYTSALAAGSSCSMVVLLVFSCFLLAISATAPR